jgi:hypothetical protein
VLTANAAAARSSDTTPADQFKARGISLQVNDPTLDQQAFNTPPLPAARGTVVKVLISGQGMPLIGLDRAASRVTTFADTSGRNLQKQPDEAKSDNHPTALRLSQGPTIAPNPIISDEGKHMVVTFRAPCLPSDKANAIHLKARLKLRLAEGQQTIRVHDAPLKVGPLDIADEAVRIVNREPAQWEAQPLLLRLEMSGSSAKRFAGVRFFNDNGKDITARRLPDLPMAEVRQLPVTLKQKRQHATIELRFYKTLTTVTAAIDLRIGLGLAPSP